MVANMVSVLLGVVLLLAMVGSGCAKEGDERGCTAIGCTDKVTLELGSPHRRHADALPLTLRGCVGENCASWTLDAEDCKPAGEEAQRFLYWCFLDYREQVEIAIPLPERGERELPVTLAIHSKDGTKLFEGQETVKIAPYYPNGYECDKYYPCFAGKADFSSSFR